MRAGSPIESAVLLRVTYDPERLVLEVQIAGEPPCRHAGVPELVYWRMRKAPAPAAFYVREIRSRYWATRDD
jgi:hypothetical protein